MIVTETKMVVGTILKVSRSKPRCTLWGEYLFHAREVVIRIKKTRKPKVLKMYIREDSLLSQMKVPPNALINKSFQVTVHGEAFQNSYGCMVIDHLSPIGKKIATFNLNEYFDIN